MIKRQILFGRISQYLRSLYRSPLFNRKWFLIGAGLITVSYLAVLLYSFTGPQEIEQDPKGSLVTQEFRFNLPVADEVFLVWGVNGWNVVPEEVRPIGTEIKDNVMHTLMRREDKAFVAKIQVPPGTTLDYGFLITKTSNGGAVHIWEDDGQQDYHTTVTKDGVIEVQSRLTLLQEDLPGGVRDNVSFLDIRLHWPQLILLLIGVVMIAGSISLPALPRFRLINHSLLSLATIQIVVILVIGAIFRFNHITQPFTDYMSWRQASTAMMADNFYHKSWNIFYPEVNWNGPGPSYQGREFQTVSFIAALLYPILGQHDWVGRTVAALFGLWGIFALYQLVRRVWDEKRALASAVVMALLPGSIFIERSFLPDPVMVALVVTSCWLLVAYFQTERWHYLLLAGLIGTWGLLTKIPGLIVGLPLAYAMWAILGYKRLLNLKQLATIGLVAALILLPVVSYYLWVRHLSFTYPPYHFAGAGNWLWDYGIGEWLKANYFLPILYWNLETWMWTKPIILLFFFSLFLLPPGWYSRLSIPEQHSRTNSVQVPWLFHVWLLAGVIYYLIGARELVYNSWNLHIINPAAAALVGHAIVSIASFLTRTVRWPVSLVTVAVILLSFVWFGQRELDSMYTPQKPWDATESYKMGLALRQMSQPDDLVVTIPNDIGDPVAIYYSQRRGWVFPPAYTSNWAALPGDSDKAIQLFDELRASGADWFGIVKEHKNELWQNYPAFIEHLKNTCEFQAETSEYLICHIQNLQLVRQEVRYYLPEAGEVFLVWGINGWNNVAEEMRPAGTVLKDTVMNTPMAQEGDTFVTSLEVPVGVTIDYGFLVTRKINGASIKPVWEANEGQDYHTVARQNGLIEVKSKLTLTQATLLTNEPGDNNGLFLIGLGFALGLGTIIILWCISGTFDVTFRPSRLDYLRDLLRELVVRDIKLRYKRSVLGVVWSLLNPLAQLLIFVFLFRKVLPLNIPNYPLFVFSGVLAWTWFQSSLFLATGAITDNRELIRRPGFPAAILPVVTVMSNLIHFLLALPILLLFVLITGIHLTSAILMLLVVIALQFLLTLSLAYLVATFHVTFRDTQHLLGILLLLLFYLTPVFYNTSAVPEPYQWLYFLNPMAHLIQAYRTILIQGELPGYLTLLSLGVVSAGLLGLGYTVFVRASYRFVEEL